MEPASEFEAASFGAPLLPFQTYVPASDAPAYDGVPSPIGKVAHFWRESRRHFISRIWQPLAPKDDMNIQTIGSIRPNQANLRPATAKRARRPKLFLPLALDRGTVPAASSPAMTAHELRGIVAAMLG